MARTNKFASVNLNDSYGKRDQPNSASARSRFPTVGGMLVLSRPGKGQASNVKSAGGGGPAASHLPGKPSPPLTNPELTDNGSNATSSHLLQGWVKSPHGETRPGTATASIVEPSGRRSIVLDDARNSPAISKRDVYAPPALRAMQPNGARSAVQTSGAGSLITVNILSTPVEKPSAIIRGEEFPTLQASMARPPTPPQHPKQKDAQLKQHEKHQEMKEQQLKLQQLSVQHQSQADSSQAAMEGSPSLRPYGRQGQLLKEAGIESKDFVLSPSSISSQPSTNESGVRLSLRPQGRAPFGQNNLNVDSQQQGPRCEIGYLCLPETSLMRSFESTNIKRDLNNTNQQNNDYKNFPDTNRLLASKERKSNGDSFVHNNGLSFGLEREDKHIQCEEHKYSGGLYICGDRMLSDFGKRDGPTKQVVGMGGSKSNVYERETSPLRDAAQGLEGLYEPRQFRREPNNWVGRSPHARVSREVYPGDNFQALNRVTKEACIHSCRDAYGQDKKSVYDKEGNMTRALRYGNIGIEVRNSHQNILRDNSLSYGKCSYGANLSRAPNDLGFNTDAHDSKEHCRYPFATDENHINQDSLAEPDIHAARSLSQLRGGGIAAAAKPVGSLARTLPMERPLSSWSGDKKYMFDKWASETQAGTEIGRLEYATQKFLNKNVSEDFANGGDQRAHEDDMGSWEDNKLIVSPEEERRKEAARQKLMELEERIARRTAEEKRKEELEGKAMSKKRDEFSRSMEDVKEVVLVEHSEERTLGSECGVGWKEVSHLELLEPSTCEPFRGPTEGLFEGHDMAAAGIRTTLNEERKVISWRKEVGNGPTSKLFSSLYAESGGFRRPGDGGTYQLF